MQQHSTARAELTEALSQMAYWTSEVRAAHDELITDMAEADRADAEYDKGILELFYDIDEPDKPTPGALYVSDGKPTVDERKDRKAFWVANHQRTDLLDAREAATTERRKAEARLEEARNQLSIAKRRTDALIAITQMADLVRA